MPESVSGKSALALALFRAGALRFGKITQPSGKAGSFHLDLRAVPSDPETYQLAVAACSAVAESMGEDSFDAVAGVGMVGIALAAPLAYHLKKPMLSLSTEGKEPALWTVEGAPRPRWRTLVLSGDTAAAKDTAWAVEVLRKTGCVVKDVVVLVDRQEGGGASLAARGVAMRSFVTVIELAEILHESKTITKANYEMVRKQVEKAN